ncbi:hypothetical protein [Streptomyces sp. NPDC092903]|uniref:hypothetical protein n=1 Tax=Streptomyces sp. NPDC092903 TaxID=3366017 RepID=UPI0037FEA11B
MYVIREMEPGDRLAITRLWEKRQDWARTRGVDPICCAPLAYAVVVSALPLVFTCDAIVVAVAAVALTDPTTVGEPRGGGRTLDVVQLVTDPDTPMPADGSLSWIVTAWISDLADTLGCDWLGMRVVPRRLAEHLQTKLAWELESVAQQNGDTVHLLRRPAERSDAIHALVHAASGTGEEHGLSRPELPHPVERTS